MMFDSFNIWIFNIWPCRVPSSLAPDPNPTFSEKHLAWSILKIHFFDIFRPSKHTPWRISYRQMNSASVQISQGSITSLSKHLVYPDQTWLVHMDGLVKTRCLCHFVKMAQTSFFNQTNTVLKWHHSVFC